jgi:hypothetical protein
MLQSKAAQALAQFDAARLAQAKEKAAVAIAAQKSAAAAAAGTASAPAIAVSIPSFPTAVPAAPIPQPAAHGHSEATSAVPFPPPPTNTRRLLQFLLQQDYHCHGPLLASTGVGSQAVAEAKQHFSGLREEENIRRQRLPTASAVALAPLPEAPFPLLRAARAATPGASLPAAAFERLDFFTPLHAFRFEQTQQMSIQTLLEYYANICKWVRERKCHCFGIHH